jgi:hypothetical protein
MRNMSFFLTTAQFLDGTKDVTRRKGWRFLKPGDRFMAWRVRVRVRPPRAAERHHGR